jgi:hypothetical protein
MKKLFFLILISILSCSFAEGQDEQFDDDEDLGIIDYSQLVDITNPIYDVMFSSCTLKSAQIRTNFVPYDQCSYKTTSYGVNCLTCGYPVKRQCTICDIGCALTVLSMILKNSGYDVTPASLQTWMADPSNNGFNGCSTLWQAINKYPDANNRKVKLLGIIKPNEPLNRARDIIKSGGFATIKVATVQKKKNGTINYGEHHMLLYDYIGDGTTANPEDFIVSDPATSQENTSRKKLNECFTNSYPSASFYYTGVVTSGAYKSQLYSVAGNARASFKVVNEDTNEEFDLNKVVINSLKKIIWGHSPLKSGIMYCNQLWVITDPTGLKTTYTTEDFDFKFTQKGTYTVLHIVEAADGFDTDVKIITVIDDSGSNPDPDPPSNLDFTISPSSPVYGQDVTFTAKDHSLAGKLNWDFGDGNTDQPLGYLATHHYNGTGIYQVKVNLISNPNIIATGSVLVTTPSVNSDPLSYKCIWDFVSCSVVATNQSVVIIDRSYYSSSYSYIEYVAVNWGDGTQDIYHTDMCTLNNSPSSCPYAQYPYSRIFSHSYATNGKKTIKLEIYISHATYIPSFERQVNVLDCASTVTENDFSQAFYDNSAGTEAYWAGVFALSNLNKITAFNDKKIKLTTCNNIILKEGFKSNPSGSNSLKLTANDACLSQVYLKSESDPSSISSNFSVNDQQSLENSVLVYPNPNNGVFTIEFKGNIDDLKSFSIFNSIGLPVFNSGKIDKTIYPINLNPNAPGLYTIKIVYKNSIETRKIIYY